MAPMRVVKPIRRRHDCVNTVYDLRQLADYGESASLTYSHVQTMLQNAQDL